MKQNLMLLSLFLFAGIVNVQYNYNRESLFPKHAKYFIKGGEEIPYDKIDSVVLSWGGNFGKMISVASGEERIYLSPPDPAAASRKQKSLEKLNDLVGKPAPDFALTDIAGKHYQLKDLKGKVVVLNFWLTACVPCMSEMPELNMVKEKYKEQEVVFLALGREDAGSIKEFLKNHTFNYTLLADAAATAELYNVASYPTSMVIYRTGTMRFVKVSGANIRETLSKGIDEVL